jgi:hypothetical protein
MTRVGHLLGVSTGRNYLDVRFVIHTWATIAAFPSGPFEGIPTDVSVSVLGMMGLWCHVGNTTP